MSDVTIRQERPEERRAVETLVREAFWNVYRPGCSEHYVLHVLREDPAFLAPLNLVLEVDGRPAGHVAYMRSAIAADDGRTVPCATLGPICVAPDLARRGYGKQLLDRSLEVAAELGLGAVFLEGDAAFYGKSGFVPAATYGIRYAGLPEGEEAGFFLCRLLEPGYLEGVTGEYAVPAAYFVDDADVEAFDAAFPPKQKLRLPGQLFG